MDRRLPVKRREWDLSWDLSGCLEPLVDIRENGDEIVVTADLPNVKKDDIEIYATENTLEITAKMRGEYCFERWGTLQRGVSFSSFRKVMGLPATIDVENIKSRFNKGILEMRLHKKSSWRKINIQ